MPKVVGYIKGSASLDEAGGYTAEGLPNIIGSISHFGGYPELAWAIGTYNPSGALSYGSTSPYITYGGTASPSGTYGVGVDIDASRSSSIYGNSDHVTPETITILFGVYAYGELTVTGSTSTDALATGLATVEVEVNKRVLSVNGVAVDAAGNVSDIASSGSNYIRFTNGIQICWGYINIGSSCDATVTLPVPFKDWNWSVTASCIGTYEQGNGAYTIKIAGIESTSSFYCATWMNLELGGNQQWHYQAIGYWK